MTERPQAENSLRSRLRRPVGRLRDLPIWSKLGLIMIVPTIATIVVGSSGLVDHLDTLNNANRAHDLAVLSQTSGELVNNLQDERAYAVLFLGATEPADKKKYGELYKNVYDKVEQSKGPYSEQRGTLENLPINLDQLLRRIDQGLSDLPATRSQVTNAKILLTAAAQSYEALISDLLDMRDSAAQLATDPSLSERMRAAANASRAKEFLSQRRVVVHQALIQNVMTPTLRTDYIGTEQGQQQAVQSFKSVASRPEGEFYDQTLSGPDQRVLENYSGWITSKAADDMKLAPFDANDWDATMVANAKLIRTVEAKLDSDVVDQADQLRSNTERTVFLETGLLLSILLLSILFAWLVARSMARSLRELRHGALSIAQYGLPQAVSRLRDPQLTAQMSPAQLATQIAEPLPVRSRDEFGQVTEAFNAVHLEAVRTAAEQAALRSSVATMFVNLARRSQILVDRLIGHLDRLERGEEDPDRLAELFQLDHLATRMRRNDENLLVLAGADSTRVQREPAALIDVLRAAQSEVEHYTRIEFGIIDRDIEIAAHAVNDLVHLVAELFDNATAFSPPDSQIMVEARRVGDRASLYVEDRGIGITQEQLYELNERLATPPQVDVAVSRMMGLVVVARLASRHGVKVELRPGSERGTVADVTLPSSVLVPRALAGRTQQPAFAGTTSRPQAAAPAFASPLALESAPTAPAQRPVNGVPAPAAGFGGGRPPVPPVPPLNGSAPRNGSGAPGRGMPAWSDLTGAAPGPNRGDSFAQKPRNGSDVEPLPQRPSTDQWTVEGEVTQVGPAPQVPRQVSSSPETWSTGPLTPPVSAPPVASAPPVMSAPPVASAPPLPPASSPHVVSAPPSAMPPRPVPAPSNQPPARRQPEAPARPQPEAPVRQDQRPAPAGAPPAWPPVVGADREAASPPVPERLSAALDMTTELPRVPRTGAGQPAQPAAPQSRQRFADETMELPIFRELESAWFRTRRSTGEEATRPAAQSAPAPAAPRPPLPAQSAPTEQFAAVRDTRPDTLMGTTGNAPMANAPLPARPIREAPAAPSRPAQADPSRDAQRAQPVGSGNGPTDRRPESPAGGWRTAADDGWRAASAATDVPVSDTTETGLPKRVPMAQLVPGGVEKPATSVQRRTPEAVRGLLSAYHRGVQRGRTNPNDDNSARSEPSAGRQSSQAGSGPAAGSGQKEHEG